MSVVSVRARSFILALFIRDDGERFLLGDNGFDFKDSQLHFSANTIENDEVEKQGVDGVMLAGQVRRASVQSFDGYVGDGSTLKEEVEQMRRDFIAFFAKGHHFRVIYIDCNRNAWQRKGGYLVDAPEVKELWQIHPEYHVGLNFEDVNYYEYDENAEGEEILSNIISVPISSDVEGGLVWDENGAVSEQAVIEYDTETASASGTSITVSDAVEAPLSNFSIKGNTVQDGTPNPDYPQAVKVVTGENVVKINGKNLYPFSDVEWDNPVTTAQWCFQNGSSTAGGGAYGANITDRTPYKVTLPAGTYKATAYNISSNIINIQACKNGTSSEIIVTNPVNINSSNPTSTITLTEQTTLCFRYRVTNPSLGIGDTKIQLEKGSATDYEPYQEQSYSISLGSIELCKIGTYQDYIYKNDGKWYVHKETGKRTYTADDITIAASDTYSNVRYAQFPKGADNKQNGNYTYGGIINFFTHGINMGATPAGGWNSYISDGLIYNSAMQDNYWCSFSKSTTLATMKEKLNGMVAYYVLATPTDTEITNEALIEQLEAILSQGYTYAGTNNITTVISAGNAQGELEITYYTKYDAKVVGGGYVWEAGGSGGPTVVTNESISAVSPVWTVFGPALNPMLENTTTGEQIQYVGMVGEGQTLVVDMGEQTARLDGLNVISNIVGEYLTLAPGSNTLLFSAEGDAPASEIGWSEIVG